MSPMAIIDLESKEVLNTFSTTKPKDYQEQVISDVIDSLKMGRDVAIQLPTGTGKSFVYLPISLAAADKGYRVCVLEPTNLILDQLDKRYLPMFKNQVQPYNAKGIEHYTCLITNDKADYAICTPDQRNKICVTEYASCKVLHTNEQLEKHGIILTNFHKFLSTPTQHGFDILIIDDSHGFENALDDKFQSKMSYYQLERLYQNHEDLNDMVADYVGNFLDIFDDILTSVPPGELSRRVPDDNIKQISQVDGFDELQNVLRTLEALDRDVCYQLINFVKCCQNSSLHTFYAQKDFYNPNENREAQLIARKSETFKDRVMKSLMSEARVVLVSATMGDIQTHAFYCTHRNYDNGGLDIIPSSQPPALRNWFKKLYIFETIDFPGDEDPIPKAVETTTKILGKTTGKTLLLFKNYRDQRRAEASLQGQVKRQITFIDDSYDAETVQTLVEAADVIMATASSRLWEGIDIRDLQLEVIFSLPFIRPPVHLDKKESFPFVKRKMLIRLQQGIGRLIRKPDDSGVCIIFDKDLEKYKNSSNFSEAYRERIRQTTIDKVAKDVEKILG